MPVESFAPPDRASITAMDESLQGMMTRLRAILASPALTEDLLVEITSIYNNVSYIFLYLEANERHVNYDRLLSWRGRFYCDPELDHQLAGLLEGLRCADPEAEVSRGRFLAQLREKAAEPDQAAEQRMAELLAEAKGILGAIARDQLGLLQRLGLGDGITSPPAAFYRLTAATPDTAKRAKLAQAWRILHDRRVAELAGVVDQIIAQQRRQAASRGYPTALAQTLEKCGVSEAEAESFLDRYLAHSLASYGELAAEVQRVTGATTHVMDHFGAYLRAAFGDAPVPQIALDECLDYIFAVARATFGLDVRRAAGASDIVLTTTVHAEDGEIGQIHFDLWDTEYKTVKANTTKGIRNRTDWSGLVQRPVAYVSCRFRRGPDGVARITFQNAHSLCHEFGHAINHLLIRRRIPNQSGLEYLPLERVEDLSMWSEKWVFHPEFARHVLLGGDDRGGLERCQEIKKAEYRQTYVDRAVTAALDFDVHRRRDGGVAASFRRIDERFGVSRYCQLGDFLPYFTWPMLQANPGAYFAYLWGASASAEMFAPYLHRTLEEAAARPELRDLFTSCFDFDAPSREPDTAAVFDFYLPCEQKGLSVG